MPSQNELAWEALRPLDQWLCLIRHTRTSGGTKDLPFKKKKKIPSLIAGEISKRSATLELASSPPLGFGALSPSRFFTENFSSILLDIRLAKWSEFIGEIEPDYFPLTDSELRPILGLSVVWDSISTDSRRTNLESIESFVKFLVDSLSWSYVGVERVENFRIHLVGVSQTNLNLPNIIPVIFTFVSENRDTVEERLRDAVHFQRILEQSRQAPRGVIINVVVGDIGSSRRYLQLAAANDKVIPLDERELQRLFLARRYSQHFNRLIRANIGIGRLNPYTTEKPVDRMEMFFGRADEIEKILSRPGTDYMVVGSRRIGKSSLLKYLQKVTEKSGERIPIYVDCAGVSDPQQFAQMLAWRINPRRARRIQIENLPQLVKVAHSVKKLRYLLLMDEVDELVNLATAMQDWRIFEALRELSNARVVQSIFTGYTVLYEAWKNLKSPLFNFVSLIYLSTLTESSARKLIIEPMTALGVSFGSRKTVRDIINETGGHPSFLQFFCSSLVDVLESRGRFVVTNEERQIVRSRDDYYAVLLQPFQFDLNFSSLEKFIVLQLTKSNIDIFEVTPLIESLEEYGLAVTAEMVVDALQNLVIAGLLRAQHGQQPNSNRGADIKYEWTIPAFPVALWRTYPVAREVERMAEVLKLEV